MMKLLNLSLLAVTFLSSFVHGQHMTFKCGSTIYICSNKVTKDTMCITGTKNQIKKGSNTECNTMRGMVKTLGRPSVFDGKCPNGKKMSHYVQYNSFGKLGKKYDKNGSAQCKGAHCGGDPHFLTYDGTGYDYHGQCDLVMAHSDNIQDSGLPLDIHARTKIITDWSYISNVAIRVGTDIVEITSEGELYWNDISIKDNTEYPLRIADRFNLTRTEKQVFTNQYRIDYVINLEHHSEENGNDNIRVSSFKNMLSINVDTILSDTYGMLGITNKDGLYGRDLVTTIEDVNVMGDEWQVHDNEPMLFQNVTAPQFPERCVVPQTNSRHLLQSDELNSIAMDACADIQDKTMKSFCIQDVLITGDHEYAGLYHGN